MLTGVLKKSQGLVRKNYLKGPQKKLKLQRKRKKKRKLKIKKGKRIQKGWAFSKKAL
jgi:hypothetical protein